MKNYAITIGREFGSGGLDIGRLLSDKLDIKCYDKELLSMAAKESGLCEEIFYNHDEKPTNSFLYSLVMDTYSVSGYTSAPFLDMPLNHKVFLAQFDAIKNLATKESCIIVGRCADYALADHPTCVNVFIHAEMDFRIQHIMDTFDLKKDKAKDLIQKTDKQRASYYNYYSSKKWGDSRSFHLTLDSGHLGMEGCADMIIKYMDIKEMRR
ncbi:cytidylate kinase-like family protein [Lachnospiraceae bacterium ZAX-1]